MKHSLGKYLLVLFIPASIVLLVISGADFENVYENILLIVTLVGLVYIRRLKSKPLLIGWCIFTLGVTLDFLDQFIKIPDFLELYLEEPALVIGLAIAVYSFYQMAKKQKVHT
ncbi:hypothetical protein [Desulforamulus aeronauticus]|uniref:Uncharacterized protein n=1 Tax=Desulforamulus aeronauticus DSM 10349 TaxID=1121421 RepID=A0A1M6TYX3_9FIRM|nr:hypothetical protein [Desulforamulus aeronauticus]SHK62090.1 hypothetical protein SAMN02745123_02514 [Desulforamulus aeronauticus DSM 10349]